MKKNNEESLQKKYAELQILNQKFQQMYQNLGFLEKQIIELTQLKENLSELKSIKENTKIFVPFGGGVYIQTNLNNISDVLINVGADTLVKKSVPESKGIIEQQINKLSNIFKELETELNDIVLNMQQLEEEINSIS